MTVRIDMDIQPAWAIIRRIREAVEQGLSTYAKDVRNATVMTASELVENAVKYGESVPDAERISFALVASDDCIRIDVTNGTTNAASVAELSARIEATRTAEDKLALYLRRLEELISCPTETGRLGLYRIAFEGAFELSCSYERNTMTVTAVRRVS